MAARAATEEVLTSRVIEQMKATDLADIVDAAARSAATEIVGQTVGNAGALTRPASPAMLASATQPAAQEMGQGRMAAPKPVLTRAKPTKNGRGPETPETSDPNP
jgi:hypothetical protein